jgi:Universal stress protein family
VKARRVLVATDHHHCPGAALEHGAALAGPKGEVVLASVLVVPMAQPLEANMERAVGQACALLEASERSSTATTLDTRLVRARSFADGVLDTLAAEPFDLLVLEKVGGRDGMAEQIGEILERADTTVAVIRPR